MDDAHRRLVAGWLAKAEEDLHVARLLIAEENRLNAAGAYHCQQAAEKALKAWLTARNVVSPYEYRPPSTVHRVLQSYCAFVRPKGGRPQAPLLLRSGAMPSS